MAEDNSCPVNRVEAFCRSAGRSPPSRGRGGVKNEFPPQRLPGFELGRIDQVTLGEIVGWRWWKVIDGGSLHLTASDPFQAGLSRRIFRRVGGWSRSSAARTPSECSMK